MPTLTVTLPRPLDWQAQVIREASRFNVVAIGRRAGKTALGINRCADPEVLGYPVGWFAPTYKDMLEVWREVSARFAPITKRASVADRRLELVSGGVLEMWSLDNVKAGRSRRYKRIIIDEAAFVPTLLDSWNYAIRPTLADFQGDAFIFSTPKGRNGFWQLHQWGIDPERDEWRAWQMPTTVNPLISANEIEEMRRNYPERVFAQEIEAQFLDDAGGVFRHVIDAATMSETPPEYGRSYVIGVDWGKSNDFTVLTVLRDDGAMVCLDRFNQIDYTIQTARLRTLANRYNRAVVIAESNSMGVPLIELLQREGLAVQPFMTTAASKTQAIDALSVAFERAAIRILNDPVLIGELQAYEMERLPSGMFRYNAPEGMHDDCVMSLAMAWQGIATGGPLLLSEWDE